jgi:RimJ/RimL family protein N-acetyltransferase
MPDRPGQTSSGVTFATTVVPDSGPSTPYVWLRHSSTRRWTPTSAPVPQVASPTSTALGAVRGSTARGSSLSAPAGRAPPAATLPRSHAVTGAVSGVPYGQHVPSLATPAAPPGSMAALTQPEIRANGVLLRPWQPSDRPAVVVAYADPAIQRWHCRSMTDDEAGDWIDAWPGRWRSETGAGWAVLDAGDVAGQISLRRVVLVEGLAEVSYRVLPGARGRRIAPRALSAVTAWAFGTLRLHRVELCHSTANVASCRVAQHAGFTAEGTTRGEGRHADGWHDMHPHARLDNDVRSEPTRAGRGPAPAVRPRGGWNAG